LSIWTLIVSTPWEPIFIYNTYYISRRAFLQYCSGDRDTIYLPAYITIIISHRKHEFDNKLQRLRGSARSRRNGRRTLVSGPASRARWSVATCHWRSRGPRTTVAVHLARPPLSPGWTITIACWLSRRSGRSTPATIVARPVTTRPGVWSHSGWSSTVKETKITDGRPSTVFLKHFFTILFFDFYPNRFSFVLVYYHIHSLPTQLLPVVRFT